MTEVANRLIDTARSLARILKRPVLHTPPQYATSELRYETVKVRMRDGIGLATDMYLPPRLPAPCIAVRTPYARGADWLVGVALSLARRGYAVLCQDCRGTGDSEPNGWDYYLFEPEDGYDFVDWIRAQTWFDGFLGSLGGSYVGQTQWQMAMHPSMSTIVPAVSGLGVAVNTLHLHMFNNAYARSVGKGEDKVAIPYFELEEQMLQETLATGYFNEALHEVLSDVLLARFPLLSALPPAEKKRWLWEHYCSLTCAARAEFVKQALGVKNVTSVDVESLSRIFGHSISHDRHTLPHPRPDELVQSIQAPAMLTTGWYDWGLNDALATWTLLQRNAREHVRSRCRLLISPSAHAAPGYHEGMANSPELQHFYAANTQVEFLLHWYEAVRERKTDRWPTVIYYLMGANEWQVADAWPPSRVRTIAFYLGGGGRLVTFAPRQQSAPDQYTYDPTDPTPTVGGSILSFVYTPGSVDVAKVQDRRDVLVYTTEPLKQDLDVVGPLRMILYASSSALDTDFAARLSDVFPDGRAIQLQNGVLRARYRSVTGEPELLVPGHVYRFEIDLWATANRFKAGHRLRVDISSADFPRFDRNTNRGGDPGECTPARQAIYRDPERPSHLLVSVSGEGSIV